MLVIIQILRKHALEPTHHCISMVHVSKICHFWKNIFWKKFAFNLWNNFNEMQFQKDLGPSVYRPNQGGILAMYNGMGSIHKNTIH